MYVRTYSVDAFEQVCSQVFSQFCQVGELCVSPLSLEGCSFLHALALRTHRDWAADMLPLYQDPDFDLVSAKTISNDFDLVAQKTTISILSSDFNVLTVHNTNHDPPTPQP